MSNEIKQNIVRFEFHFLGKDTSGNPISKSGVETVVVNSNGKIVHVEVVNK